MCFGSSTPPPTTAPAAAPAPPAIPATQSATSTKTAEPEQQIGFGRKRENKTRFGTSNGPDTRRTDASFGTGVGGGSGLRM